MALDEINTKLSEFDGYGSPGEYMDWEFYIDQCIGNFPHSSYKLGTIIINKLISSAKSWWKFHMIDKMMYGYA